LLSDGWGLDTVALPFIIALAEKGIRGSGHEEQHGKNEYQCEQIR
jgi:hypothetical protein